MKNGTTDLESLWNSLAPAQRTFDRSQVAGLPDSVRTYLVHSIAEGAPLANGVRLRMHGKIKLGRWRRFRALQVIARGRGMVWQAKTRISGLSVRGEDRYLDGEGAMRWRMMSVFPLVRASGADITRSAAGRFAAESIWLPSLFCDESVSWQAGEGETARARFAVDGHAVELALAMPHGRLHAVNLMRWGNPGGGAFREESFGAFVDQEATFHGYTIPARLRAGWFFDDPTRFEREGKFFEVAIDDAVYR